MKLAGQERLIGGIERLFTVLLLLMALFLDATAVIALTKGPVPQPSSPGATTVTHAIGIAIIVFSVALTIYTLQALSHLMRPGASGGSAGGSRPPSARGRGDQGHGPGGKGKAQRRDVPPWERGWQP